MATFSNMEEAQAFFAGDRYAAESGVTLEELTENGNWVSYQRDNKPDISI